ncbi:glycolate oxidase subunit GlcE [Novosphingobium pentaromativorans]|uniref:FAD linked oxidase domain protein n=1 Tax=Novosphingobium pentaromativorans US6-1 TaxID=1088721 RepID=G6EGR8_9SPHN|nr:glycolate oxidase subunit GlcE [Novosphingobium pentaromativorans]AIT82081.1 FAD-linked oxidase [Novosphingobium pentaromativorans US6-1]EHJ59511.1 FAD linked oxidase domain protein [Novosphingobium pentaromativorans US6-1]
MAVLAPDDEIQLAEAILAAAAEGRCLNLRGGGSKAQIGAPADHADILDMRAFQGIVDYDPAELVLTARAGTPLFEIVALLRDEGQSLAFDPFDHGPIFARPSGAATIGGVVAAGVAGSRRLTAGSVRDHLLGFSAVSGRGECFVAGAKVVKNVTGYDLPKLMAGSWGRLAALVEVTLKVLPAPRESVTCLLGKLDPTQAYIAMARVLGSSVGAAAAAYLPADIANGSAVTALRIEGFGPSVKARVAALTAMFSDQLAVTEASPSQAAAIWDSLRTLAPLDDAQPLWRLSLPARSAAELVAELGADECWMMDWGGGLLWLSSAADPQLIRKRAARAGGHAMLVRGDPDLRSRVPALPSLPPANAALEARIRRAFDPAGVFETGRFGKVGNAD